MGNLARLSIGKKLSIPCKVTHFRTYIVFFHSLFILPYATASEWDWVPRESLTQQQQSSLNQYCAGAYLDAWQASPDLNSHLTADLIYRDQTGTLFLQGGAELIQPNQSLTADKIQGRENDYYHAQGNVELRQEGQLIRGQEGYLADPSSQTNTRFDDASFLSHQTGLRGQAKSLSRDTDGVLFIEEGFYTTCEPGEGNWQLYGSAIELNTVSGFGTAKHIQIRIDGNPIFYFPWLRFPLDDRRQSGFLFPTFAWSSQKGLKFSTPFYWNVAPNYDATITPQFIEYEGEGLDLELRHLSPFGSTQFEQATFDHKIQGEQTARTLTSVQDFTSQVQVGLLLEENTTPNAFPSQTSIGLGDKDSYKRNAYASFNEGGFASKATVQRFQTPDSSKDKPFEWQPRLDASYRYANTLIDYSPTAQYTDFYDPDEIKVDGTRQVLNQTLNLNLQNAWGTLTPGVIHQFRSYQLHDYTSNTDSSVDINHLSQYVDGGIVFERSLLQDSAVWRQTLEPKFSYLNAPFENQDSLPNFDTTESTLTYAQAFDHQRFTGNDRIGDTEQYTLGLESRLFDSQNQERWAFKLAQVFYLQDRQVDIDKAVGLNTKTDPRSSLLSSVSYKDSDYLSVTTNVNYDADIDLIDLAQVVLKFAPDNGVQLNSSFLYTTDSTTQAAKSKQSDISAILPLSNNWHFLYQQTYDWLENIETKKVAGFGFENCCLKMTFNYQRWRDSSSQFDEGIFFQFILRSLSGVGRASSIDSVAKDYWNQGNSGY